MKRIAMIFICLALLLPGQVHAGGKTCKPIRHGVACYVNGQRVSVRCNVGYELSPSWGSRCVRVK